MLVGVEDPPELLVGDELPPALLVGDELPPELLDTVELPPALLETIFSPPPAVACEYDLNRFKVIFAFTAFTIFISVGIKKLNIAPLSVVAFA